MSVLVRPVRCHCVFYIFHTFCCLLVFFPVRKLFTMEAAAGSVDRDRPRRDNAGRAAVRYTPYGRGGCGPEFMRAVGLGVVAGFVGCGISAPLLVRLALWLGLSTCLTYYIASSVCG